MRAALGTLAAVLVIAVSATGLYVGAWHHIKSEWPTWAEVKVTVGEALAYTRHDLGMDAVDSTHTESRDAGDGASSN